jgi:DNA polymerase
MTAEQKRAALGFLDMAEDYLSGGHYAGARVYDFPQASAPAPGGFAAEEDRAEDAADVEAALAGIAAELAACSACALAATRKNTVPGEGVARPLVLVLGEAPGADEDATGRPFVGRAGQLLDKMLGAVGLSRTANCFIANMVKCRPPDNRDPEPAEKTACRRFLLRQIALLRPRVILAAGRVSSQALLETDESISRLRGRWGYWQDEQGAKTLVLPTFHPSYLLRDESQKVAAWDDLTKLSRRLATLDAAYDHQTVKLRDGYEHQALQLRKRYQG